MELNKKTLEKILQLPSLPTLAMEIMDSFSNDLIDASALASKISQDPAITLKLVSIANSSFFGLSKKVGSVQEAIVVIGFNSLRGLVTAAILINAFPSIGKSFNSEHYWQHSIETGSCAKILAKRLDIDSEVAFTAGLLHDIGRLVLSVYFYDDFLRILEFRKNNGLNMKEAEQAVMGLDHAALGGKVAEHWHLPLDIQIAISEHHMDEGWQTVLSKIVYVANQLSQAQLRGISSGEELGGFAETLMQLGIDERELDSIAREVGQIEPLSAETLEP